jgi:cardiolipin synthase
MYLATIAAARKRILMGNSYFLPSEAACAGLLKARDRGVEVRIVLPGPRIDWSLARAASQASWEPLLEAGVEIFEYQPTMYHAKLFVADDRFVSVGSTNFDPRSFHLNMEANLNAYDETFAREVTAALERDITRSRRITLEEWRHRPLHHRAWERVSTIVRHQL